jgi:hypothetical protein
MRCLLQMLNIGVLLLVWVVDQSLEFVTNIIGDLTRRRHAFILYLTQYCTHHGGDVLPGIIFRPPSATSRCLTGVTVTVFRGIQDSSTRARFSIVYHLSSYHVSRPLSLAIWPLVSCFHYAIYSNSTWTSWLAVLSCALSKECSMVEFPVF